MKAQLSREDEWSFDVRIRGIRTYKGARRNSHTVRWDVAGRTVQQTFATAKLADGYRSQLLVAARAGEPFHLISGLPQSMTSPEHATTWIEHCVDYVHGRWPYISPHHRKSLAETLTGVSVTLTPPVVGRPHDELLRKALYRYAFNPTSDISEAPAEVTAAYEWLKKHSVPITDLEAAPLLRKVTDAIAINLNGAPAATSTVMRKRAVLHGCLQYAVERGHFTVNPLHALPRRRLPRTAGVDRRVVVNPDQARSLLSTIRLDPELEGFFACICYAGLRPAEARNLRLMDCSLPEDGWGTLLLSTSFQSVGPAWTDGGQTGEERQLKHRDRNHTRPVPAAPELVETLRRHIAAFHQGVDGRLFVNRRGRAGVPLSPHYTKPVSMSVVYRAWHRARASALTGPQVGSPLARRPYDLRHACLSTWLNAGVPPAQVAAWAGHTVRVLLQVYSKCIDGQDEAVKQRIEDALGQVSPPAAKQPGYRDARRQPGLRPVPATPLPVTML
jgi:integrase